MHRDMLAENISVANSDTCDFVFVSQVLRRSSDNTPGKEMVVGSDGRRSGEVDVWLQDTPRAQSYVPINHDKGTHLDVRTQLSPGMNDRARMNHWIKLGQRLRLPSQKCLRQGARARSLSLLPAGENLILRGSLR